MPNDILSKGQKPRQGEGRTANNEFTAVIFYDNINWAIGVIKDLCNDLFSKT